MELTEASNLTLGQWLDKWLTDYMTLTLRESTLIRYKGMIEHQIKPYLGDEKISAISTADIQQLYNWLRENGRVEEHYEKGNTLSDSMVRGVHMMLHQALDAAVREHLIPRNPTEGTVIPKGQIAFPPQTIPQELAVIRRHGPGAPQEIHCGSAAIFVFGKQRHRTQKQRTDLFRLLCRCCQGFKLCQISRQLLKDDLYKTTPS